MKVSKFIEDFRSLLGDETKDIPDDFLIKGLNWAMRDLPLNPKLAKIFSKHFTVTLDAKRHWRWDISCQNGDKGQEQFFDYVLDLQYLNFWTSTGGDVCHLKVCPVSTSDLYTKGIPKLMEAGKPCEYTLERDGDKLYLVLDRPSDVPIVIDYIAYGIPKEVTSVDDEVPLTKLVENAIISAVQAAWYQSATDMAFSISIYQMLDNKWIPQLIQEVNKRFNTEKPVVLGG